MFALNSRFRDTAIEFFGVGDKHTHDSDHAECEFGPTKMHFFGRLYFSL